MVTSSVTTDDDVFKYSGRRSTALMNDFGCSD